MPGPTPNTRTQQVDPPPERSQIPQQVDPSPERIRIPQQFDQTPLSHPDVQTAGDMINPGSPTSQRAGETINSHSPESPTFVTPPSSPVSTPTPQGPAVGQPVLPPETPTLPRRSTRVSRPPDRLTYDRF